MGSGLPAAPQHFDPEKSGKMYVAVISGGASPKSGMAVYGRRS